MNDIASKSSPMSLETLIATGAVQARLIYPGVPTPTVPDAARALGVSAGEIVKSLVFRANDGQLVMAVATGTSRINRKRLAREIGARDVSFAPPEVVLAITGYPPGGTPPVGHSTRINVLLDEQVMQRAVVFGGGGLVDTMMEITPAEICRVTGARIVDIADPE